MVSKKKQLDSSFPEAKLYIESYSQSFRLDRTGKGGGIMLYVREEIPPKLIQPACRKPGIESFSVEINLRRKKWLLVCN